MSDNIAKTANMCDTDARNRHVTLTGKLELGESDKHKMSRANLD